MRLFFTIVGCIAVAFALTSKFIGDILKDVLNWLY